MREDNSRDTYQVLLDECCRKQIELDMAMIDIGMGLYVPGDYALSSLSKYLQKAAELKFISEKLRRVEQTNKHL